VVKAELVARIHAVRRLIDKGALPFNVQFVIEAESATGSPYIADLASATSSASLVLWSGGAARHDGVPLLYTGVKGLLQVELHAEGARIPLPTSYAGVAPNPLWQLVSALASIKSVWEEVTIEGFYDAVTPPSDDALARVRDLDVGEAMRCSAWGVDHFSAGLRGPLLARVEAFSPNANLSAITFTGNSNSVPNRASASLQFQLVPDQRPDAIFDLLQAHLAAAGMASIRAQRLCGGYAPHAGYESAVVRTAIEATHAVYGAAPHTVDLAPFSGPASLLVQPGTPLLSCGLERPDSALYGPDESVALHDLRTHFDFLVELLQAVGTV
jgi:acetylornithine deacetylase/succinyl-diaminopimelate desuccinylase-like protein